MKSDVFLAFKGDLHSTIPTEIIDNLLQSKCQAKVLTRESGTAYILKSVEWDRKDNLEINNLYVWLTINSDFMDYMIVVVYHNTDVILDYQLY